MELGTDSKGLGYAVFCARRDFGHACEALEREIQRAAHVPSKLVSHEIEQGGASNFNYHVERMALHLQALAIRSEAVQSSYRLYADMVAALGREVRAERLSKSAAGPQLHAYVCVSAVDTTIDGEVARSLVTVNLGGECVAFGHLPHKLDADGVARVTAAIKLADVVGYRLEDVSESTRLRVQSDLTNALAYETSRWVLRVQR